jgi:serine/threonine-protein kinase
MTTPPEVSPLPKTLGRYEIHSEIGRGAMGVVYKAGDPLLGRSVALKVIQCAFPLGADEHRLLEQRFLHEASLAASLSHPNIVVVHDVGFDAQASRPFIALEYLEGRTLAAIIACGESMDWRECLRMTARLADALHHAHAHGVVHRDIKPSNIMVLPAGHAKILDFGVAKTSKAHVTAAGELWGTPSYMSPEQASGQRVDGRSDLFSLGTVLYELLTGRRAFGADGIAQVIHRLLHEEPPRPSRINAALPREVDLLVARALSKDLEHRYPDGRAFVEDIEDVLLGRSLRERGLAAVAPEVRLPAVESGPSPSAHKGPPTLTTRRSAPAWQRGSTQPARARNLLLGGALAIGVVVVFLGATSGPAATWAPAAATARSPLTPAGGAAGVAPPLATTVAVTAPPASASVPPPVPVVEPARVAISLEHDVKDGKVRVWVDDKIVLERTLAGTETRNLLFFKKRRGVFAEVLSLPPGQRTFRLEVEGDGEKRSARLRGTLRSDETRLLEAKAGGKLRLEWKS